MQLYSLPLVSLAYCKTFLIELPASLTPIGIVRPDKTHIRSFDKMTSQSLHLDIVGTRVGHVIRYTCPVCTAESSIVNKTPRDHFKEARVVSCKKCRSRLTVLTPGHGR